MVDERAERSWTAPQRLIPLIVGVIAVLVLVVARAAGSEPQASQSAPSEDSEAVASVVPDPTETVTPDDLQGLSFREVSVEAGLDTPHSPTTLSGRRGMTSGAAVADVDGDGHDDVFVSRVGAANALYRNNGDATFSDVAAEAGVQGSDLGAGSTTAAFADIDGDSDLDLFVAGGGTSDPAMFVNDGTGHFTEESDERNIAVPGNQTLASHAAIHGVTFHDVDTDGDLDAVILDWDPAIIGDASQAVLAEAIASEHSTPRCAAADLMRSIPADRAAGGQPNRSRLLRNDGAGVFADVTVDSGIEFDRVVGFTAQFGDADGDGLDDLFLTGDGCTSRLYRNLGDMRFDDVTAASGVGTDENGRGSVLRDLDADGDVDWFISGIAYSTDDGSCPTSQMFAGCSGNRLYLNNGDGTFTDETGQAAVGHGWWGAGVAAEDLSNNGLVELVMTNGYLLSPDSGGDDAAFLSPFASDPMRLWVRSDDTFVSAANSAGLIDIGVGHALVPFDYDSDGRLDLFVANSSEPPKLFRNEATENRHWLTIRLDDPITGNPRGIGAKVVAVDSAGGRHVGWITTSGSYESQKPAEFHVGLGDDPAGIAQIEVWWPGAAAPQVVEDVPTDQRFTITRQ